MTKRTKNKRPNKDLQKLTIDQHDIISTKMYLNKVLQKFSTARPSSSVAKHKLLRDTKKQQDVITSNRVIMTS